MYHTLSMDQLTDEFYQPTVLLFYLISPTLRLPISSLSLRSCITFELFKCSFSQFVTCFAEHSWGYFQSKDLFSYQSNKWPASADFTRAIASDAIGLLVTLSNFFDFHVIGTVLLLPHRNTIWAP